MQRSHLSLINMMVDDLKFAVAPARSVYPMRTLARLQSKVNPESFNGTQYFKQATAHDRKAREIFDDTGARALYLAVGFLQFKAETRDEPTLAPILLVPAEMRRLSKAEGHAVRATGEDAVVNAALVEYMRLVHGVDLGLSGELETDDAGLDVAAILARVRERIRDCPGMTVVERAKLGVYNFRKLPLYQEMEAFG